MNVAPAATFEAFSPELASGLVGTVGVRIRTSAGADFLARTTAAISADVTVGSTSTYRRSFTAPTSAGQYWLVWDDGTSLADPQELVVTYTPVPGPSGSLYITTAQVKATLQIGQSYADDDLDLACVTVSRAIDRALGKGRRFYQATETRYYSPEWGTRGGFFGAGYERRFEVDDLVSVSSLTVDNGGDGSYSTTWTEGTHFYLDPPNALLDGFPYEQVLLRNVGGGLIPWGVQRPVKLAGTFGWPAVPPEVSQYAKIFTTQLVLRSRDAPFGILMAGMEVGATARLMRVDPDFRRLLGRFDKQRPFV